MVFSTSTLVLLAKRRGSSDGLTRGQRSQRLLMWFSSELQGLTVAFLHWKTGSFFKPTWWYNTVCYRTCQNISLHDTTEVLNQRKSPEKQEATSKHFKDDRRKRSVWMIERRPQVFEAGWNSCCVYLKPKPSNLVTVVGCCCLQTQLDTIC